MAKKGKPPHAKKSNNAPTNESPTTAEQLDSATVTAEPTASTKTSAVNEEDPLGLFLASFGANATEEAQNGRQSYVRRAIDNTLKKHKASTKYNILMLHDETRLARVDADNIYSAITKFPKKLPILLVLYSSGGDVASAYLISKLCREYTDGSFVVVVPRQAKSAATLICCGADEIHMGSLSELGPIDPQIGRLPALGLKNAVEHIAGMAVKYPQASEMFARYLHLSIEPINIGFYERVVESASQYAERLLKQHSGNLTSTPDTIANKLTYAYKDHGFVIDRAEATEIFGSKVVKQKTPEYELGNAVYGTLRLVGTICEFYNHTFYMIGSPNSNCVIRKRD